MSFHYCILGELIDQRFHVLNFDTDLGVLLSRRSCLARVSHELLFA